MTIMIVRTARPTQELSAYCNPFPRIATPPTPSKQWCLGFQGVVLVGGDDGSLDRLRRTSTTRRRRQKEH